MEDKNRDLKSVITKYVTFANIVVVIVVFDVICLREKFPLAL